MPIIWQEYLIEEQHLLLVSFVEDYQDVDRCKVSLSSEFPSTSN